MVRWSTIKESPYRALEIDYLFIKLLDVRPIFFKSLGIAYFSHF